MLDMVSYPAKVSRILGQCNISYIVCLIFQCLVTNIVVSFEEVGPGETTILVQEFLSKYLWEILQFILMCHSADVVFLALQNW